MRWCGTEGRGRLQSQQGGLFSGSPLAGRRCGRAVGGQASRRRALLGVLRVTSHQGSKPGIDGPPGGGGGSHPDPPIPCRYGSDSTSEGNPRPTPLHTPDTKPAVSADPDVSAPPPSYGVCMPLLACLQGSSTVGKPCSPSFVRLSSDRNGQRVPRGYQSPVVAGLPASTCSGCCWRRNILPGVVSTTPGPLRLYPPLLPL